MCDQDNSIVASIHALIKDAEDISSIRCRELTQLETDILTLLGKARPVEKRKVKRRQIATSTYDSDSDSSVGESNRRIRFRNKAKKQTRVVSTPPTVRSSLESSLARLGEIERKLNTFADLADIVPLEMRLLRQLFFESIDSREDAIHDAASGTFRWMLDGSPAPDMAPHLVAARNLFLSWLASNDGAFHISGNAGSGKSTLMKFISHHPKTKAELVAWAGDKKLVFSSFYFWNSGTPMQMSLEGLYRSILLEVSRQCPDMLPQLFPDEWAAMQNVSSVTAASTLTFDLDTTEAAFRRLLAIDEHPTHNMCFFIDGLDEYMAENVDYAALARTLRDWGSKPHVKVCVSARPYPEFLGNFSGDLSLHLHELTAQDIRAYVGRSLEDSVAREVFRADAERIIKTVVRKSEGVFLWPRVVVRALLTMASRGSGIDYILKTLDEYPSEIDGLYDQMLGSLPPDERHQAHKMLVVASRNPFAQAVNALWLSWLDEVDSATFPDVSRPYSAARIKQRHENVSADILWLTKGLLEMHPDRRERKDGDQFYRQRIQFFHRTARDYIHDPIRFARVFESLGSPDLLSIYASLRLGEIVLAGKYRFAEGADPRRRRLYFNYVRSLFGLRTPEGSRYQLHRRHLNLLRQDLEATYEKENGAYAVSCFKAVASDIMDEDPEATASFLHLVASYGQSSYVLGQIRDGLDSDKHTRINLLLSAAFGQRRFSVERFGELVAECPSSLGEVVLRPSSQNDPLATTSFRASLLITFAAAITFKFLGERSQPWQRGRKASDVKQASDLVTLFELVARAAIARGQDNEFLVELKSRSKPLDERTSTIYITTFDHVRLFCSSMGRDGASKTRTAASTTSNVGHAHLPRWTRSQLSHARREIVLIEHHILKDYFCTKIFSATEEMDVNNRLFFRIY
ncbi:hypothetical protein GQ53DRAFT_680749 [Thozetella sp. PMI_491]|nr:hypothetical protein GQ53DRAFT_680749 [Thozetella sp. PMI_491]